MKEPGLYFRSADHMGLGEAGGALVSMKQVEK